MLVAVSVDMEGASQLRSVREIWGCLPEYWQTGKPWLEADVCAACEGLLAGGASELVVLDNHGGNTVNVSQEALPEGVRLETWRDFDLREHGVDATFEVGYHARGGVDGFLSHTYVPGLRLRAGGELISESHGRAWASALPLLAIRAFAEQCIREAASARAVTAPTDVTFEASMPNGKDVVEQMTAAGWSRSGEVEFSARFEMWKDARELLAAAMNAALVPFAPYWLGGFESAEAAAAADHERVAQLRLIFDAWAKESHPQWYSEPADPLPAGVATSRSTLTPQRLP